MELDRSRFVSILSLPRHAKVKRGGGKMMMERAEGKLQMNHKTTAGSTNSPRKMSGGGMISSASFLG